MQIEFDPAKDALNRANHGVSLKLARDFDSASALVEEDDREDYGEVRWFALGRIGRGIYALVFTRRGSVLRAISLRRATKPERERFHAVR